MGILARSEVGEGPGQVQTVELAIRVLVEAADADIPDALTVHGEPPAMCQVELSELSITLSGEQDSDPGWAE